MGLSDGYRGHIDSNQRFSDGYRENDPEKKSAAGRILSDYSGVRGGEQVGKAIGKWGGGLAIGLTVAFFSLGFMLTGGVLAFAVGAVGATVAGVLGGTACSMIGGPVGKVLGGVTGAVLGSVTGAFNAVFRRGYFEQPKEQEVPPQMLPPVPDVPRHPDVQQTAQPQMSALTATPTEAAANPSAMSRVGKAAAIAGGTVLAAAGVKSAVHAAHQRRRENAVAKEQQTSVPAVSGQPAAGGFAERIAQEKQTSQRSNGR